MLSVSLLRRTSRTLGPSGNVCVTCAAFEHNIFPIHILHTLTVRKWGRLVNQPYALHIFIPRCHGVAGTVGAPYQLRAVVLGGPVRAKAVQYVWHYLAFFRRFA
jgi:hypothetical protein